MVFDLVFEQMCSIFAPCVGLAALLNVCSELWVPLNQGKKQTVSVKVLCGYTVIFLVNMPWRVVNLQS